MNRTFRYRAILVIAIVLTLVFVFSNSLPNIQKSSATSERVTEIVEPVLEPIVGEGKVTNHLVRKLAHFAEFALLGFELGLLFTHLSILPFFVSLLAALTDETIQIFAGRGSQVQDVWLDFAGACVGIVLGVAVYVLVQWLIRCRTVKKSIS